MAQTSGPRSSGTATERQLTDILWRDRFGDEAGVLGDLNGTAYALTRPTTGDDVQVGSATQASLATVAGFSHKIPAGTPETITIPAAVGSNRTDLITLRYDPTFTGPPGPVRLTRVPGSSATLPVHDDAAPGVEDLPLWAITRKPGESLAQATVQRLFPRVSTVIDLAIGAALPLSSPLGTIAYQGAVAYRRELSSSGTPAWVVLGAEVNPSVQGTLLRSDGSPKINPGETNLKFYPNSGLIVGTDWMTEYQGRGIANSTPGVYIVEYSIGTNYGGPRYIEGKIAGTEGRIGIADSSSSGFGNTGGTSVIVAPNGIQVLFSTYSSTTSEADIRTSFVKVRRIGKV